MSHIQDISGLTYSEIGILMKHYDRRLIAAAVLLAKNHNKANNIAYVRAILGKFDYFITARKDK